MPRKLSMKWRVARENSGCAQVWDQVEDDPSHHAPSPHWRLLNEYALVSAATRTTGDTWSKKKRISLPSVLIKVCLRGPAAVMYVVLLIVLFVYISKDHIACLNNIALQFCPSPTAALVSYILMIIAGTERSAQRAVFIPHLQSVTQYHTESWKTVCLFPKEIWPLAYLLLVA